jgi:tRNA pseudouridine55 synthase
MVRRKADDRARLHGRVEGPDEGTERLIDGLAVIDKPPGMTSHDVVARCRRLFGQKRVGHAGTLDPDATGVLLVGLGRATRLMQFMSGLPKSYEAVIVLGAATSTLDASGDVTQRWDMSEVSLDAAREAARALTGTISQVPPMVSAVKVGGRRLHELAREGLEVDRAARTVTVSRFELEEVPARQVPYELIAGPLLRARVDCSSGTYVRVLAADLGQALGGGAHVGELRRTRVGPFDSAAAVELDALGPASVLAPFDSLPWMDAVTVGPELEEQVRHGRVLELAHLGVEGHGPWRVASRSGALLAVYQVHRDGTAKPVVVVAPEAAGTRTRST